MQGAYAFINERPQPYPLLKLSLSLNPHTQTKFDIVNQHIRNIVVLPGQLVIIPDARTASCTVEEAQLMRSAQNIKQALLAHSATDQFLIKNYDLLQVIMTNASIGVGSASSAWSKHLAAVERTLHEIDALHKQYLSKGTTAARDEFLAKRRVLFAKLEGQLSGMARLGTGLKNEGSIKKMLGISTKSYWHHGGIRKYEETVKRIAKASQMLKKGHLYRYRAGCWSDGVGNNGGVFSRAGAGMYSGEVCGGREAGVRSRWCGLRGIRRHGIRGCHMCGGFCHTYRRSECARLRHSGWGHWWPCRGCFRKPHG